MAGVTKFEAGNEFANPMDAVQEALGAGGESAPEAPVAEEPQTDVSNWSDDKTPVSAEAPKAEIPQAAPVKVKVKGAKGEHEFDLSPESEELKRTLSMGLGAGKWKQERDQAKQELQKLKAELESMRGKASPMEKVQALTQRGHLEQAVRAAIGEENFQKFIGGLAQEFDDYTSGDPDRRAQIEKSRFERAQRYKDEEAESKVREATARLEALESKIETDRLHSVGSKALQANDFRGFIKDSDHANALNQKLWKLAWTELEELGDAGTQLTDSVVAKVFQENAKVLQAGLTRQVEERVSKVIADKKAEAKATAQVVATERYPKGAPDLSGWDGRSSKDLLKRLVGSR